MVDNERSTLEKTLVQIQRVGYRVQALACSPSQGILSAGNLSPVRGALPPAQLELSPRRYHVFARAPHRDAPSTIGETPSDELWTYVAAIHRKPDAIAVSAGLGGGTRNSELGTRQG
jgi:hypothetical protein